MRFYDGSRWRDGFPDDAAVREYAADLQRIHDPDRQTDGFPGRCAMCSFTRHPCDVYDLATVVLGLLDERASDG